jgi:ubiquinone/menaquinone biosynthesis C-methylase UbiE
MFTLILDGKLALAPIDTPAPAYVLDIATGTGIWAIQFSERHPTCHVVGTDLSIIQPNAQTPNCEFIREDSETQEWVYPYTFDYIHLRAAISCFDDFKVVLRKSFNHLSPGGWFGRLALSLH